MKLDVNQLTTNDVVKLDIIHLLSTQDHRLSVTSIAKQLGYKYDTIRSALGFLLICTICCRCSEKHGNRVHEYVGLTELGRQVSKQIE